MRKPGLDQQRRLEFGRAEQGERKGPTGEKLGETKRSERGEEGRPSFVVLSRDPDLDADRRIEEVGNGRQLSFGPPSFSVPAALTAASAAVSLEPHAKE